MQLLHDIYDNFVKNLLKGPANCHRARINKSAPMLQELSVWTTPLSNHVKNAPYLLYFFPPFFRKNWLNISTPQLANCGPSNVLPIAKSVLFSFACSNQNLTHFLVRLLTLVLKKKTLWSLSTVSRLLSHYEGAVYFLTLKPSLLIWLMVSPFSTWSTLWCHLSTINLAMLPSLPISTG